jgi:hypothetical protein
VGSLAGSGGEPGEDLVVLREAPGLLLREDELAVDDDVELAVLARGDGRGGVPRTLDLGGETRRPLVVARSDRAVEDLYLHYGRSYTPRPELKLATAPEPPRVSGRPMFGVGGGGGGGDGVGRVISPPRYESAVRAA